MLSIEVQTNNLRNDEIYGHFFQFIDFSFFSDILDNNVLYIKMSSIFSIQCLATFGKLLMGVFSFF